MKRALDEVMDSVAAVFNIVGIRVTKTDVYFIYLLVLFSLVLTFVALEG